MTFDQAVELLREKVPVALAWIGARFGNTWWYIEYRRDDEDAPMAFFEIHTFADGMEIRKDYYADLDTIEDHPILNGELFAASHKSLMDLDWEFEPGPAGEETDYEACKEFIAKRFK